MTNHKKFTEDLDMTRHNADDKLLENLDLNKLKYVGSERVQNFLIDIASNPNAPPEILTELAKHSSKTIRRCVASNPNTPPEILRALANDCNRDIRMAAVSNDMWSCG